MSKVEQAWRCLILCSELKSYTGCFQMARLWIVMAYVSASGCQTEQKCSSFTLVFPRIDARDERSRH